MANVIDFLEKLGQDSQLRHAASTEVDAALRRAGIDPAARTAILNSDRRALESLLGARSKIVCAIFAPEEEEEQEDGEENEEEAEEDDKEDAKDDVKAKARDSAGRRVA